MKFIVFISLVLSIKGYSNLLLKENAEVDKSEKRDGFSLKTGKVNQYRIYQAKTTKLYQHPPQFVAKAILDFENRCNNEYHDLREHLKKDFHCPFFNKLLVETIRHPIVSSKKDGDQFVTTKIIKNRGRHVVNELVTVKDVYENGNKNVLITIESINDQLAKQLTQKELKSSTVITKSITRFYLKNIGNESTLIDYSYEMKTDHWLINKIIAASSVFDNMHENIINLLEQIEKQTTGDGNIQANTQIH
ncbi:MAG: hypothetical protein H6621_02155 [Halobacteriovoraceae bacterium]|nr:hypothetical protein [Halobacteriovoraceae bacterium]MCB9093846.1 hypothetical protein [Halobacteriovoraceae bacterium]